MSKIVLVDRISLFRMRYAVELPDNFSEDIEKFFDMKDSTDELKEFSQLHLEEVTSSMREITQEEFLRVYREDNDWIKDSWDDKTCLRNGLNVIRENGEVA